MFVKDALGFLYTSSLTAFVAFRGQYSIQPSTNRRVIIDDEYSYRLIRVHFWLNHILAPEFLWPFIASSKNDKQHSPALLGLEMLPCFGLGENKCNPRRFPFFLTESDS